MFKFDIHNAKDIELSNSIELDTDDFSVAMKEVGHFVSGEWRISSAYTNVAYKRNKKYIGYLYPMRLSKDADKLNTIEGKI